MQSVRLLTSLLVLLLVIRAHDSVASPLDDAQAAYQQGQFARAYQLFKPLADLGNAEAQFTLGVISENGWGVLPQDYAEAARWFHKAADQGNAMAQYNLGYLYKRGMGVPKDFATAMQWFRKAADQGHENAQFDIGLMYANGEGVTQDYVQAYMWFNLLAAKGHQGAAQYREQIAGLMTSSQIAEAQKMTREYVPNARQIDLRLLNQMQKEQPLVIRWH
jgi:TPR repeat protein